MVLIPPYIEVDGLVVLLRIEPPVKDWPARVLLRDDLKDSLLDGLMYVTGALIHEPATHILSLLGERRDLPMPQELSSGPLSPEHADDFRPDAKNWERLTGSWPDMSDAYHAGASFLRDNLVIPRTTFIKLMTRLYELNDAVREGRMEPRIDEFIPLPPPRPPLPEPPLPRWTDQELQALEEEAVQLDELDPLSSEMTDGRIARRAEDRRSYFFAMLEAACKRIEAGEDDLLARFAQLELKALLAYQDALTALRAYLRAPERVALIEATVAAARQEAAVTRPITCAEVTAADGFEVTPFSADVSIDLFRLPAAPHLEGTTALEWLARCEAFFLHARITGAAATGTTAGDLFTRVLGHTVRLRFRPEMTPVPRLWRVDLV